MTVTSEYAEIIYFLRNGNLYRRVLLILPPEYQPAIVPAVGNQGFLAAAGTLIPFAPSSLGNNPFQGVTPVPVSWQGVNDISAHPATTGPAGLTAATSPTAQQFVTQTIVLNTLGSLTNRENRFALPRFSDDFYNVLTGSFEPDGYSDDLNGDKIPDFYPSLYPNVFNTGLINAPNYVVSPAAAYLAFPYIFPGAYSCPQVVSQDQYGWIHSPTPYANVVPPYGNNQALTFEQNPLGYLECLNHNPLDVGDNLPTPTTPPILNGNISGTAMFQTWWGFPTWRETLSVNWNDPTRQVNDNIDYPSFGQPNGLAPRLATTVPVTYDNQLLPWMSMPLTMAQGGAFPNNYDFSIIRRTQQLFSNALSDQVMSMFMTSPNGGVDGAWSVSWEDDLIMTNVRSFDIKAYDNALWRLCRSGLGGRPAAVPDVQELRRLLVRGQQSAGAAGAAVPCRVVVSDLHVATGRDWRGGIQHADADDGARGPDAAGHGRSDF